MTIVSFFAELNLLLHFYYEMERISLSILGWVLCVQHFKHYQSNITVLYYLCVCVQTNVVIRKYALCMYLILNDVCEQMHKQLSNLFLLIQL